jgi:hypothetical protein
VGNEVGLWLLAHAANAFDADREAVNSLTEAQFSRPENAAKPRYPYTDVNLEAADRIRRDEAGAPVLLTQFRIVSVSDPTRTAAFEADREDAVASEDMSVGNRIARDRKRLRVQLDQAREQLNGLMALADSAEAGTLTAFGSRDEWHALHAPAADIQTRIWANQPQEEPEPEETADEEDDQD